MKTSNIKYAGFVNDKGQLKVSQQKTFKLDIASTFKDKKVWVIIEERSDKPSKSQWGYLWAVIIPKYQDGLFKEMGMRYTPKETQHFIEETFLQEQRIAADGNPYTATRALGDLRKPELTILIDQLIINAATELSTIIPYPDEKMES